jgi:chromosome segregation ATPase
VVLQHPVREELALLGMSADQLAAYAASTELESRLRRAFAEMGEMRGQMGRVQRDIDLLQQQREAVFKDQERLRENLARVPGGSDLARRYLEKLGRQESALETINDRLQKSRDSLENLRQKLADYIQNLAL